MTKFTDAQKLEILEQSHREYLHALQYRQKRELAWQTVDDLYFGRKKKSLVSRANIHLPFLQGAVETWVSKVDDPPSIAFDPQEEGDKPKANKMNGLIKFDARNGFWELKDIVAKRLAGLYGRAIYKKFSSSKNGFTDYLEIVDPLDFLIDPLAGGLTPFENASYCGQDNIIRSKWQLQDKEIYDVEAVNEMATTLHSDTAVDNRYGSKFTRRTSLGLSDAVLLTDDSLRLVEWVTTYHGERAYCFFSPDFKRSVRTCPLTELFDSNEFPYSSWAVFPHAFEFWTPGIGELLKEANQVQNVLVSQMLDNNAFRNYGMKIYDSNKITNPALLDPKPMGKVPVNGNPKDVVMDVNFPSIGESINLLTFVTTGFERDSGVTGQTKGMPNSKRMSATEFAGLLDQVSERIFTTNRTYRECYRRIGQLYYYGIEENLTTARRVKVLGARGFEWAKVNAQDVKGNFDVVVSTSSMEEANKTLERDNFLKYVTVARENTRLNQAFLDEKEARVMGFTDDEVERLLNPDIEGDWEILAEAAAENEQMLTKKAPANKAATTGHLQKHMDFVTKTTGLKADVIKRVQEHVDEELMYALKNMEGRAKELVMRRKEEMMRAAQASLPQQQPPQLPTPPVQVNMPGAMPPGMPQMGGGGRPPMMPPGLPPLPPGMAPGLPPSEMVRQAAIAQAPQPNAGVAPLSVPPPPLPIIR